MKNLILLILVLLSLQTFTYSAFVDTSVPSTSAGSTGLYTRIFIPDTTRYFAGAPVVIYMQGGVTENNLDTSSRFTRYGFIVIEFNYPGGINSGGTYDYRGPNCILALRDIIKFASGVIQDNSGRYLHQLTSGKTPMYTNVGLVGSSNGGNITLVTAGYYGNQINLSWILNWESPVGEPMPGGELGVINNSFGNPRLNAAYNDTTGLINFSKLKYSDTLRLYYGASTYSGGFYFDINGNNRPDRGSDFVVNGYWTVISGVTKYNVSTNVIYEAITRGVYPSSPPAHLCSYSEANEFWRWRSGDRWIDSIKAKLPNMMFIITASDSDHVQSQPDHPHVYLQYDRFRIAAPRLVRLNADRSYVEYVMGGPQPTAPDNNAFEVYTRLTIRSKFTREAIPDVYYQAAGVCELADRTCAGITSNNLSSVIFCNTIGINNMSNEAPDKFELFQNYPNPFNPETAIKFEIPAESFTVLKVYDISGRLVETLLNRKLSAGTYLASWDASQYSSGVYFYKIQTKEFSQTKKMILIK